MDVKLTLKLNETSIEKAKDYVAKKGQSLSGLVENFFNSITTVSDENTQYSPIVQELSGIISLPDNYDYKADYISHLEEKYE